MSAGEDETSDGVPRWAIYAGVGIASWVAYKTLFSETKFKQSHRYEELKSDAYTADYPSGQKYWATNPWDNIEVRRSKRGPASWKPTRVFEMLEKSVSNAPNSVYWRKEYLQPDSDTDYAWKTWTRQDILNMTKQAGRAFIACGLEAWEGVALIGFNSPEWISADLGAIHAGGIVAGIYTTNNAGQCKYIAVHSKAAVAVVEGKKQLKKFLHIRQDLENLKVIVVWDIDESDPIIAESNNSTSSAKVLHWNEFMKLGSPDAANASKLDTIMQSRIDAIKPGQCCTLIYTSGTTGPPKAVMISHDNVTWQARCVMSMIKSVKKDGSPHASVSFLPLSHVAAQLLDIYFPMAFTAYWPACTSWEVFFARPSALKGTLGLTLKAARPTLFFGVPRVWEKIQEALVKKVRENPPNVAKKCLLDWLKSVSLKAFYAKQLGGDMTVPFGYSLADKLLLQTVKEKLGFDRVQAVFTGAAPTSTATLEFWASLGLNILETYGMSEASGLHSTCLPYYQQMGTVGVPLPGVTTLLQNDPERDTPGHGEICMRGRHVMMGYMYDEDKTKRAIDDEGYLHSGDVGVICDKFNVLRITGRIKELIITAGGENIAPVPIEDYLKNECPGVSNVVVIGDRKKYLVCLVTLKVVMSEDKEGNMVASNTLDGAAKDVDEACESVDDVLTSDKWKVYIQNALDKYNRDPEYCVSNAQKVQYFRILHGDFGVDSGELTATMKLKRPVVNQKYNEAIESMYSLRVPK